MIKEANLTYINKNEIELVLMSVVDDIGILFTWEDRLFRAIKEDAVEKVKNILDCGMIHELIKNNLFPNSWITNYQIDGYGLVIEHTKIKFVSYPYEWTFSMLKDAALAVLKVNIVAKKYGYQTKDCHSFNVVFDGLQPMFVDLGSFVKTKSKSNGWMGYEEFLKSYYYPLKIWSSGSSFIARSIIANESSFISYSEYLCYKSLFLRCLPLSFVNKLTSLYFKYRRLSFVSYTTIKEKIPGILGLFVCFLRKNNLLPFQSANFVSLNKKIERIHKKKNQSRWSAYHNELYTNNGKLKSTHRFNRIIDIISTYNIRSVVELAGNQGALSKLLLESGNIEHALCTDYDEDAVDLMYLSSKKGGIELLTPALLNCVFPITVSMGKPAYERFQADEVIALALTHHLLLSDKLRIDFVLDTISKYSKKYVLIEFMPLGLWDGESAPPLPQWYTLDWFRRSFQNYFKIISEEQLEKNRILFLGDLVDGSPEQNI